MTSGAGRNITYTSFNMVASIAQGTVSVAIGYDSEHNRVSQTLAVGSNAATTIYLNDPITGAMSEKLTSGSTVVWHDYIASAGGVVAEKFSGGTTAVRYFVADHLGSAAAAMDESGAVVERDSYDAWGKRRNIDGSDDAACSLTSLTSRGYTGHEHIDAVCLINMNARIYDPVLGRFTAADSVVPDPSDGQSFNRYAYVNNGPLSATDPSGHGVAVECDPPTPGAGMNMRCHTIFVPDPQQPGDPTAQETVVDNSTFQSTTWYVDLSNFMPQAQTPVIAIPRNNGGNNGKQGGSNVPNKGIGQCSINRNLQGWGNWFLNKGAVVSKAGSVVTILGLSVDAIPTPPTWITGSTGVAIGGGMVAGGTVMQTAGAALLYTSGDQRGAAQGAIGILLAAPQNDITAVAPIDPTDATAAAITNAIYGPNTCQ